jgi:asparagine synthase (glutamine-hydrolysing)
LSGFIGILELDGAPVDLRLLRRLTAFHSFRGPDGCAVWSEGCAGLGLALWKAGGDPLTVVQPLGLDGRLWIVSDARLDARESLAESLRGQGRDVGPGTPDAAMILHGYDAWGEACLDHFLGDFSFALWDRERRRLFCAVDRFGVRPLFYARLGDTLVFGNTLHGVRLHPRVSRRLNERVVGDYLLGGSIRDLGTTIDADILRLPPATVLVASSRDVRWRRYWDIPRDGELRLPRPGDYLEQLDDLLAKAVGDRLRRSVAAVSFSGGLDSPLVARAARDVLRGRNGSWDLQCFTFVFDTLIPDREREYAGLAATALDIESHFIAVDEADLFDTSATPDWMLPEPTNEPMWAFYRARYREIASRFPVLLTGYDGDALLASSLPAYWRETLRRRGLAAAVRDMASYLGNHRSLPPVGFRTALRRRFRRPSGPPPWLDEDFARRTYLHERCEPRADDENDTGPRAVARRWLSAPGWENAFRAYDPGHNGFPIQAVHPLTDLRLVTFLLRLPAFPWCDDKEIFRASLRRDVPEPLWRRPKTPLAGDPVVARLKKSGIPPFARLRPGAAVAPYVDVSRIPVLEDVADVAGIWAILNVVALDLWMTMRGEAGRWNRLPEGEAVSRIGPSPG